MKHKICMISFIAFIISSILMVGGLVFENYDFALWMSIALAISGSIIAVIRTFGNDKTDDTVAINTRTTLTNMINILTRL